jgi:hypothetical protein
MLEDEAEVKAQGAECGFSTPKVIFVLDGSAFP